MTEEKEDAVPHIEGIFRKRFKLYTPTEIRGIRVKLGYTQTEFSQLFFAEKNTIGKWERGAREPSCSAMRVMQMAEMLAEHKHKDINHRIRQTYR